MPQITVDEISIIIPVKDNQRGIDRFLASFFETQHSENYPKEIIIVDNNSPTPIYINEIFLSKGINIHLLACKQPGPAAARNMGAKQAKGFLLLFVDSDCIATENMLLGYQSATSGAVAYQGYVGAVGNDYLSNYYISQEIHLPPQDNNEAPKYLVTANTLVQKTTFDQINGFNEEFTLAGGEDIDLALRLKQIGKLDFAPESIILHDFNDGIKGFMKRFIRYGKGIALVKKYHVSYRFPLPSTAKNKAAIVNHFLVVIQWLFICYGFLTQRFVMQKKQRS